MQQADTNVLYLAFPTSTGYTYTLERCASRTPSYQGGDTIQCDLPVGHTGQHKTVGVFPNQWRNRGKTNGGTPL